MSYPKPLRQNNLVISTASRHKGPQQNTLNCTGYFGAAPKLLTQFSDNRVNLSIAEGRDQWTQFLGLWSHSHLFTVDC